MIGFIGYKGENQNLLIRQGASFRAIFNFKIGNQPLDISNLTFRGQIRKNGNTPINNGSFVCTILDALDGQVEIYMPDETTAQIPAGEDELSDDSLYYWDLEAVDPSGDVYPFLYGEVRIFREITK